MVPGHPPCALISLIFSSLSILRPIVFFLPTASSARLSTRFFAVCNWPFFESFSVQLSRCSQVSISRTLKTIRNGNSSARSLSSSSRRCASLRDLLFGIRACTLMLRCSRSSFDDQVPRSSAFASARFLARIDLGMNPPISLRVAP